MKGGCQEESHAHSAKALAPRSAERLPGWEPNSTDLVSPMLIILSPQWQRTDGQSKGLVKQLSQKQRGTTLASPQLWYASGIFCCCSFFFFFSYLFFLIQKCSFSVNKRNQREKRLFTKQAFQTHLSPILRILCICTDIRC